MLSLAPSDVSGYFAKLDDALETLAQAAVGSLSLFGIAPWVDRVRQTLDLMAFPHQVEPSISTPETFTIDPTDSGFPHFKEHWFLETDARERVGELQTLPMDDVIAKAATERILAGVEPLGEQRALFRRRYLERLQNAPPIFPFQVGTPTPAGGGYALEWSGIDERDSLFVLTRMDFHADATADLPGLLAPGGELESTLRYQFKQSLSANLVYINSVSGLDPKGLMRFKIGPYHRGGITVVAPDKAALLGGIEDAWLLEMTIESVHAEAAAVHQDLWEWLRGKAHTVEMPSDAFSALVWLTPHAVAQRVPPGDDAPDRLIAVTPGGELVEA